MAINIDTNTDGDVTYQNPPVNRVLFPNITDHATPEEIQAAVDAWLEDHPEATTTVQDGSILPVKLDSSNDAADGYVLSWNATDEQFEWVNVQADIDDLKQDLEGLDVYTLGLYPQIEVADTAVASFTDGADDIPVKSLTVDITPVQSGSGDPSPSNVRPIAGWTGANVSVNGVNQWDEQWESGFISASTGANQNANDAIRSKNYVPIVGGASYHIRTAYTASNQRPYLHWYDANKNHLGYAYAELGQNELTATAPANAWYTRFAVANLPTPVTYNHDISINYPSTDHDYHAYKGNVYSITFPTEAGTVYGGTLDVTNGVLTVDRKIETLNGASAESWSFNQIGSSSIYRAGHVLSDAIQANDVAITANKYKGVTFNARDNTSANVAWIYGAEHMLSINSTETTLDAFKASLASTPLQVCYQITPVTYQLTPTEVATILGQNNIFADTGNINELTYRADLKAYIDAHVGS